MAVLEKPWSLCWKPSRSARMSWLRSPHYIIEAIIGQVRPLKKAIHFKTFQ